MLPLLKATHAHPLEREYEGWIVAGIERYFESLKITYAIWAISPDLEATWPADERLNVEGKFVGLQFKQAKLAAGPLKFDRLKWSLHQPKGQFELPQATPAIFYCLPTFANRSARNEALDHCLFWRPEAAVDYNAWYDNPAALTPYKQLRNAMRWGSFVEALFACTAGVRTAGAEDALRAVKRIHALTAEYLGTRTDQSPHLEHDLGLYALFVALDG